MPRWSRRPEGSNWGDFGEDDQLGKLNLITTEVRLAALAEARTGKAFSLSLPLDLPGGPGLVDERKPPRRGHQLFGEGVFNLAMDYLQPGCIDICNDDSFLIYPQFSTQWDALSHAGARFDADGDGIAEMVYYNGFAASDAVSADEGAKLLGIDRQAEFPLQTAGVLVDIERFHKDAPVALNIDGLMRILDQQQSEVRAGDVLCLYTGFSREVRQLGQGFTRDAVHNRFAGLDGSDERLLQWITDSGIVAIAADNFSVEIMQHGADSLGCAGGVWMPLHHHCLFKQGILLGELWYLHELAMWLREAARSRFLLTAAPLNLPGAVGSPLTPIATV